MGHKKNNLTYECKTMQRYKILVDQQCNYYCVCINKKRNIVRLNTSSVKLQAVGTVKPGVGKLTSY